MSFFTIIILAETRPAGVCLFGQFSSKLYIDFMILTYLIYKNQMLIFESDEFIYAFQSVF